MVDSEPVRIWVQRYLFGRHSDNHYSNPKMLRQTKGQNRISNSKRSQSDVQRINQYEKTKEQNMSHDKRL